MVIMQKDFGRLFTSLRRGLMGARVPYRAQVVFVLAVLGSVVVIGATVAPLAINLQPSELVLWATGDDMPVLSATVAVFFTGIAGVSFIAYVLFILSGLKRPRNNR